MKKVYSPLLNSVKWLVTRGVTGTLSSAHDRVTIFVNSLGLFGMISIIPISMTLVEYGVDFSYSLYFFCVPVLGPLIIYFNSRKSYFIARSLVLFATVYIGWGAGMFFGKSFNGYYIFFVSLILSLTAFVKYPVAIRVSAFLLSLTSLVAMDVFDHSGIFPVTGFKSADFPLSVLIFDTLVISGFISIVIFVEKSFSEKYETQLEDLNKNLENRVKERTHQLVKASEEAISANMRKSQFVANTSHELRTPLQGILGFSQLAELKLSKLNADNFSDEKLAKIQDQIQKAQGNAHRLLDLIERLLELTRFESDGSRIFPSIFNIHELFKNVIEEAYSSEYFNKHVIRFESELRFEDVCSDQVLYRQIVTNLIGNAVKYSHEASLIKVKLYLEEDLISCSVTNQGYGIPEEETSQIFEPFYQSSVTDRRVGGTGLGLTLCSKYAKNLGGNLTLVDPRPNSTEFKASIKPLTQEEIKLPDAA